MRTPVCPCSNHYRPCGLEILCGLERMEFTRAHLGSANGLCGQAGLVPGLCLGAIGLPSLHSSLAKSTSVRAERVRVRSK